MKKRVLALIAASVMALSTGCFCGCEKIGNTTDPSRPDNPVVDNSQPNGTETDNTDNGNGNNNKPNDDDTPDTRTPTTAVPSEGKVTVYYSNSNNWSKVYAYIWNSSSPSSPKKAWPGEILSSFATSGYGEKQYKIDVETSVYNRIIFNDGNNNQTVDLTVSAATSGFYGMNGTFTEGVGENEYGKVEYTTLTDTKNLSYISGSRKKISVYTPRGYDPKKKYGVLYMFDGQNLYEAADGCDKETHGSANRWQVDVAVNNLVKNGGDGLIIVGIDNADGHRDQELTMSLSFGEQTSLGDSRYGDFKNGKLDELGNFIKETVMPWVKEHYSVDASREKTGIAGSSSGGLAAYYLGLRDNDTYGYIGAFSPANGIFVDSAWNNFYKSKNGFGDGKPKVYVYCGTNDNSLEDMLLPATQKIKSGLTANGLSSSDVTEYYLKDAQHNEVYWRAAFPEFLGRLAK